MTKERVSARLGKDGEEYAVEYDFGDNLADAVSRYGEDVVFSKYTAQATVDLQALIRRMIKAGKTQEEITEAAADWKPGLRQVTRKSPFEKAQETFEKLSPEERKSLLAELRKTG